MRTAHGIVLMLLLGAAAGAAPPEDPVRQVESLERELVAAIAKTDLTAYDRIVADDYVAIEASGKENPKAEILASYRAGTRRYTNLEIFDVRGRVFGDTAIVGARTKGLRREGDRDIPNNVHYIRVYARRDGRWRAVAQKSSPVPDAAQ
ncbi:MAG: nuclear transport factor 2 family protein [Acidobacteria bacterium]|nr:nuclear transport factor 2 family protein [Acidobacteriota bacterium]MCA1609515.1 nuclear transport factor 2 family protein [Acidobacteriota bacterium]